ncbi:MAG: hydroxymethylbilane synthase [bacterium]
MNSIKNLILGTRGSKLAITQSQYIADLLERTVGLKITLKVITTKGDKILDVSLSKIGDKGLFTKELEYALLSGEIDMAVHSLKDIPAEMPKGLTVAAYPVRESPFDVVISRIPKSGNILEKPGKIIGTSSLRRIAQLLHKNPRLQIKDLRGNLDTRIKKLQTGEYDGIIAAEAGLKRIGFAQEVEYTPIGLESMVPAVGQGCLGIQARESDETLLQNLLLINDKNTQICVNAERSFMVELQGGCQIPIGALAEIKDETLEICGAVASLDGKELIKSRILDNCKDPVNTGKKLASELLNLGCGRILESIRRDFIA